MAAAPYIISITDYSEKIYMAAFAKEKFPSIQKYTNTSESRQSFSHVSYALKLY